TPSKPGSKSRIPPITPSLDSSSLRAGTIAQRFNSAANGCSRADPEQLEQAPGSPPVAVLVEDALAGPPPELLCLRRVGEELAVRGDRLVGVVDDHDLAAGLEPALDALVRIGDDRRRARRELEG